MLKVITALNTFLGTVLALGIIGALSYGGWFAYRSYHAEKFAREDLQEAEVALENAEQQLAERKIEVADLSRNLQVTTRQRDALEVDLAASRKEIERLDTAMRLLKVDHRLARVTVISQQGSRETNDLSTRFQFVEVDDQGAPVEEPREFNIAGDLLYIDGWVIKFTDDYIEQGDLLRSTSIYMFRRLFGEDQRPLDGFELDSQGKRPAAYRTGEQPSEFEQDLWDRFWDYANNPEQSRAKGVRAMHGEAPSIKLMPGKSYRVQLRASDGLSIVPEEEAPVDSTSSAL